MDIAVDTGGPSLTDWLQGLGTVGGTLFAAVAAVIAFRVLRHDQDRRRVDEEDALARQARSILMVFENPTASTSGTMLNLPVALHNFSTEVIMDIRLAARRRDGQHGGFAVSMDYLAPGARYSKNWDVGAAGVPQNEDPTTVYDTYVAFTDSHGVRWMRFNRDQPSLIQVGSEIDARSWASHSET